MPPSKYVPKRSRMLAVEHLVALEVLDLEVLEPGPHLVDPVDLALRAVAQLLHLPLGTLAHLATHVALGPLGLELGEVGLQLLLALLDARRRGAARSAGARR